MNDNIKVPTMQVPPLKKICMTIGQLPSSYIETMSYYEMLVWFVNYLRDDIIPVVNANGEATKELQELFVELQNYVNNYFDNLDVQDEINNKLDEMVEEGTLQEIIATYLNSKAIFGFDNVQAMKDSTNLINGSYAKTLGYYSKNDGGGATYKIRNITNDDVVDDMLIIELNDEQNQLIAELIYDSINVKKLGAKGDGTTDDTLRIQKCLNVGKDIIFSDGEYLISSTLKFNGNSNIIFEKKAKLITNTIIDSMFEFNNEQNANISQNCNITNMHIDGNDKAKCGMILSNYVNLYFENLQIDNCTEIGLKTKGSNSRQQAELRVTKSCIRNYNYGYADSIGIQIDSTDGSYSNMSVVDFETAFKINASGNSFNDLHPWIHFTKLWNNSKAFVLPTIGGDLTLINGGFIDSIRTAFECNLGKLNISNMIIYYADNLYNDNSEQEATTPIATYISGYPAQIFTGTNSTQLRISNIYSYIQAGSSNVITNIVNSDMSVSDCIFMPENRWSSSMIDFSRSITKSVTDSENITSSYKYCTKMGRLITLQYRGTLNNSVVGYTTLATLPYKPATEVFFLDAQGKKMYITVNGELQSGENLDNAYNVRFTITYVGNLTLS